MEDLARYGLAPAQRMAPALARAARGVPVGSRHGICAYALVDAADYEACMARRWRLSADGYVVCNGNRADGKRTTLRMSRVLLGLEVGDRRQADHVNLDPLDNRRSNLRLATNAQNCQNRRGNPRGTSRYRGVSWQEDVRKWKAQVSLDGVKHYLGLFESEQDAADAAAAWRELHMPFTTN